MEDKEFRICTRCGSTRRIDYVERNRKGELLKSCNNCRKNDKRYYDNHKEEQKAYRDLMKEEIKEKYRIYRDSQRRNDRKIIYREGNKENMSE